MPRRALSIFLRADMSAAALAAQQHVTDSRGADAVALSQQTY